MTEHTKITPSHLARQAIVYIRQSTSAQVEHNRESTREAKYRQSRFRAALAFLWAIKGAWAKCRGRAARLDPG
jgi:hypothetical protein